MAGNGLIDLRPHGIVSSAKLPAELAAGVVTSHRDEASLAERLSSIEPYSFFATCGLLAIVHRLRALGRMLSQARTDLGTNQDWLRTMLRDARGHTYVVPRRRRSRPHDVRVPGKNDRHGVAGRHLGI
jgi:hypothetical protein